MATHILKELLPTTDDLSGNDRWTPGKAKCGKTAYFPVVDGVNLTGKSSDLNPVSCRACLGIKNPATNPTKNLTATLPDGTTGSRKTARTYTHVVASNLPDFTWGRDNRCKATSGLKWGIYHWCGSERLAQKQADTAAAWIHRRATELGLTGVQVIVLPVN